MGQPRFFISAVISDKNSKNQISGKKSIPMILRLRIILSVVFYERKNVIFYE